MNRLREIVSACSDKAKFFLDVCNDDCAPYLATNAEVAEYRALYFVAFGRQPPFTIPDYMF